MEDNDKIVEYFQTVDSHIDSKNYKKTSETTRNPVQGMILRGKKNKTSETTNKQTIHQVRDQNTCMNAVSSNDVMDKNKNMVVKTPSDIIKTPIASLKTPSASVKRPGDPVNEVEAKCTPSKKRRLLVENDTPSKQATKATPKKVLSTPRRGRRMTSKDSPSMQRFSQSELKFYSVFLVRFFLKSWESNVNFLL